MYIKIVTSVNKFTLRIKLALDGLVYIHLIIMLAVQKFYALYIVKVFSVYISIKKKKKNLNRY